MSSDDPPVPPNPPVPPDPDERAGPLGFGSDEPSPSVPDEPAGPLDFAPDEPSPPVPDAAPRARDAPLPEPSAPRRPRRYGWFLALAAGALIVVVSINTLSTSGPGSTGIPAGKHWPSFAAPIAASALAGDVNVATKAGQGAAGARPACAVRGPDVLTSCLLTRGAPAVLAFFVTAGSRCANELDALEQVRRLSPGVNFAAVAIKGSRSEAAKLATDRGWGFPVAYDSDGVLANLYGVAVCPHITYALPGGTVDGTTVGSIDAAALRTRVLALERHARARGWRPSR